MKQKQMITLVAAILAGGVMASPVVAEVDSAKSQGGAEVQQRDARMDSMMRAHFIRVAEAAGFEVLGTSNPDSVPLDEMVLAVRPVIDRAGWQGQGHDHGTYHGRMAEEREHEEERD